MSEPAAAPHRRSSLSVLPSPRLPRHRCLQPQPGAGEAAKREGEEARDERREGVGGPEPD